MRAAARRREDRGGALNLFTIAPWFSFVDDLAAGVIERHNGTPGGIAGVRIFLPNRRAVRALAGAFLRASGGHAALLPRIRPIGDLEGEDLIFEAGRTDAEIELVLPPAIGEEERIFALARLVERFFKARDRKAALPAETIDIARALARLSDQIEIERLDFGALGGLVPDRYAAHWQDSLDFLSIIGAHWPRWLRERGAVNPAARRNMLLAALAERWQAEPPDRPVILAGTTGTIPAVADLAGVVARLPQGAVVLPGLDLDMDEDAWAAVGPTHPQYGLKALLERTGGDRRNIKNWTERSVDRAVERRVYALRRALLPTEATVDWHLAEKGGAADPLPGLSLLEAGDEREEAGAVAFIMREALETPVKTAALITSDRRLARRVRAELTRWSIKVDDSAGAPLAATPVGRFLRLVADAVAAGFAPVPLLALLKHPLTGAAGDRGAFLRRSRALDRRVLRGVRPAAGGGGLYRATERDAPELAGFVNELRDRLGPLEDAFSKPRAPLADLLRAHIAAAEALVGDRELLWAGDDGDEAAAALRDLLAASSEAFPVEPRHYPALFTALISGRAVRSPVARHPRLAIWGSLEARLQHADLLILGGLKEGSWPAELAPDPWMSDDMRRRFGLPPAERFVGLAAHDFAQALGGREVVLSRAIKQDGTPSVPSRWVARLQALYGDKIARADRYLDWAREVDRRRPYRPVDKPYPRPPVESRPTKLSVTDVELWMRDPYALYAKRILKLRPLDPLDAPPGALERGTIIHSALDAFLSLPLEKRSPDALIAAGRDAFAPFADRPAVVGFWWPRFLRVADWFLEEQAGRAGFTVATEVAAAWDMPDAARSFTLTAQADRIDRMPGGLEIIDYKTGKVPEKRQIEAGYAPQLPLEGLLAEAGAFEGLGPAKVGALAYWKVAGGRTPGEISHIEPPAEHIARAEAILRRLIESFARPETAYLASPRPLYTGFGEYDHLARIAEWPRGGAAEG